MRLIPCPENVVFSDGGYVFGKKSGVFSTSDRARKAFDDFIGKFCGYPPCDGNDILFKSDGTDDNSEEYSLEITPSGISVDAKSERGLFYGVQTLKQIIAVRMDDKTGEAVLPSLKITEKPRFSYRAFIFDCVPLPVCQTTSGKCSLSFPDMTSSHALPIQSFFSSVIFPR